MLIRSIVLAVALAITLMTGLASLGGPLTPPGAPAPTHKTLTEVEPRTAINATNTPAGVFGTYHITSPGSYYLTENSPPISISTGST
ncbi:MAG: hypothetical protein ACYTF7_06600 [Planctomycetota bacterium]|jgi:hypothetical protein